MEVAALTFQRLALDQIEIVGLLEYSTFEAATEALQIAIVHVEHESRAVHTAQKMGMEERARATERVKIGNSLEYARLGWMDALRLLLGSLGAGKCL